MLPVTTSMGSRRHRLLVAVLIEARKDAKMTQRQLAQRVKMPQSAIAAIESCQRRVDVVEFLDLAKALKVPPLELLARIVLRANH